MKNYLTVIIFGTLIFTSCVKKYKRSINVCGGKLYVEVFNVNPAGVDNQYLTDSLNFRMYVGKFDNEHGNFHYLCNGDSVIIEELYQNQFSGVIEVVGSRGYSLEDLRSKKNY